ncbi:hypothetical protein RQM47_16600 [Rubrivirga sp. S365]|uniref:hypothetical protein n=1 Tax=Rubrivirga sp. S365 TaxID=3076080 RepID=UPI0028C70BF0|nr:hypothetical protein [Rubrivirga sp. S365]MDT7858271.1 hypothetical protein [Rubrivirga sp. S365]
MSDLGLLSHTYGRWNTRLSEYNDWLLRLRKSRQGYAETEEDLTLTEETRMFLEDVLHALSSGQSAGLRSSLPESIRSRLRERLESDPREAERLLGEFLAKEDVRPDEVEEDTVDLLRAILTSLNDEVTELHSRMQPRR